MLCCLLTLSIQRSKHPLHWIVYAMLFVDTVNMKIKAPNAFNAICQSSQYKTHSQISAHNFLNIQPIFNPQNVLESWDWGLFNHTIKYYICWHCQHKTKISLKYIQCYVCQHCWYKTHLHISPYNFLNIQPIFNSQKVLESWDWGLFNHTIKYYICWHCRHKTKISLKYIQCYVCQHCWYKTHLHISPYNFLHIQPIFNSQKVLESWDWGLFNHTIKYYICWHCRHKTKISNAFNAIYVDTVNTKHIYTFLPISFLILNQFSIRKKFWKAETEDFSTIASNTIYVDTVDTRQGSLMHSMLCISIHCRYKTHLHISPYNFLNIQPIRINRSQPVFSE